MGEELEGVAFKLGLDGEDDVGACVEVVAEASRTSEKQVTS